MERKGYNGRGERSHRTDDEEFFYLPLLLRMADERALLSRAAQRLPYSNVERPHTGEGMDGGNPW